VTKDSGGADTRHAVQVADEISRRVLDAIAHEPALTLAVPGTPNLLPVSAPPLVETGHVAQADAAEDGCRDFAAAAARRRACAIFDFRSLTCVCNFCRSCAAFCCPASKELSLGATPAVGTGAPVAASVERMDEGVAPASLNAARARAY